MADAVKVHPKLMPTTCDRICTNKCIIPEPFDDLILGDTWFATFYIHCHSAGAKLPNRLIYSAAVTSDTAVQQSKISFSDGVLGELSTQTAMCVGVLSEKDYAACLFIEPVDNIDFMRIKGRQL